MKVMSSGEENKSVVLKDKREVHFDDDKFTLTIVSDGKKLFNLSLNYPEYGYGGGSIYLSPSDSYLLFAHYSGQSEESFTLFRITDKLEIVYESYLSGEAADYWFSEDEKLLIQGLPSFCGPMEYDDIEENWAEKDENGDIFYAFGQINVLDIEKKKFSEHKIRVYFSDLWRALSEEREPFLRPKMENANSVKISMPWGDEKLNFPLEDTISFGKKK